MRVRDYFNIIELENELCLYSGKLKFLLLKFVYYLVVSFSNV